VNNVKKTFENMSRYKPQTYPLSIDQETRHRRGSRGSASRLLDLVQTLLDAVVLVLANAHVLAHHAVLRRQSVGGQTRRETNTATVLLDDLERDAAARGVRVDARGDIL
jgi:hypothetical protein